MNKPRSHVALALLASALLYFALDLTTTERGPVDWAVIGAVGGAMLWNLVRLGRRLHAAGGRKAVQHEGRAVTLWLVGLMNTAWARPGDVGSWTWWVGCILIILAVADTVTLFRRERRTWADAARAGR